MALELVITESAELDLLGLWVHIAEQDVDAANRTLRRIQSTAKLLCDQPQMGMARPDLTSEARSFVVGRWLLVYFVDGDRVVLSRVFDGRRDPAALTTPRS